MARFCCWQYLCRLFSRSRALTCSILCCLFMFRCQSVAFFVCKYAKFSSAVLVHLFLGEGHSVVIFIYRTTNSSKCDKLLWRRFRAFADTLYNFCCIIIYFCSLSFLYSLSLSPCLFFKQIEIVIYAGLDFLGDCSSKFLAYVVCCTCDKSFCKLLLSVRLDLCLAFRGEVPRFLC